MVAVKVSSRAHYGLRLMTELAKAYGEGARSLAEIARAEHLPQGYLEQLVVPLKRAGLIESVRGAHGGYRLSREPSAITVGEVVRVLEGSLALVECLADDYTPGACSVEGECLSRALWQRVRDSVNAVLDSTTLASLMASEAGGAPAAPRAGRQLGGPTAVTTAMAPIWDSSLACPRCRGAHGQDG